MKGNHFSHVLNLTQVILTSQHFQQDLTSSSSLDRLIGMISKNYGYSERGTNNRFICKEEEEEDVAKALKSLCK